MTDLISVIIPTYNPNLGRLQQTLEALRNQNLPLSNWELIIVNNNSTRPITVDASWQPNYRMIDEPQQGLTYARIRGFSAARGNYMVLVDDDNLLDNNYLLLVKQLFEVNPAVAAIGGKSLPKFESAPPEWLPEFYGNLALRDLGDSEIISGWENVYPKSAPIGAGMALRKQALTSYMEKHVTGKFMAADRTGTSLSSGGDNDLVIEILKSGWKVAYFPSLVLKHIIPAKRMQVNYLARLNHDISQSWVQLLASHHINPWQSIHPFTVPFRKLKAWITYKAWAGPVNYIRWKATCGTYKGLSSIYPDS